MFIEDFQKQEKYILTKSSEIILRMENEWKSQNYW